METPDSSCVNTELLAKFNFAVSLVVPIKDDKDAAAITNLIVVVIYLFSSSNCAMLFVMGNGKKIPIKYQIGY